MSLSLSLILVVRRFLSVGLSSFHSIQNNFLCWWLSLIEKEVLLNWSTFCICLIPYLFSNPSGGLSLPNKEPGSQGETAVSFFSLAILYAQLVSLVSEFKACGWIFLTCFIPLTVIGLLPVLVLLPDPQLPFPWDWCMKPPLHLSITVMVLAVLKDMSISAFSDQAFICLSGYHQNKPLGPFECGMGAFRFPK